MNGVLRLVVVLCLALASNAAWAVKCKDLVGSWDITYKLITNWTDTVIITSASGSGVSAEDEYGTKYTAACRNGMMYIVSEDSDYLIATWFFTYPKGIARASLTTYDYAFRGPDLTVGTYNATVTPTPAKAVRRDVMAVDQAMDRVEKRRAQADEIAALKAGAAGD